MIVRNLSSIPAIKRNHPSGMVWRRKPHGNSVAEAHPPHVSSSLLKMPQASIFQNISLTLLFSYKSHSNSKPQAVLSHPLTSLLKKSQILTAVGEDVGKRGPSSIAGGKVNGSSCLEKSGSSCKCLMFRTSDPARLIWVHLKRREDTCPPKLVGTCSQQHDLELAKGGHEPSVHQRMS